MRHIHNAISEECNFITFDVTIRNLKLLNILISLFDYFVTSIHPLTIRLIQWLNGMRVCMRDMRLYVVSWQQTPVRAPSSMEMPLYIRSHNHRSCNV